jgi:hypothetical protein
MRYFLFFTFLFFFSDAFIEAQSSFVSYTYSTEDFVNPERGFYRYSETRSGNYSPLDSATLANYRSLHQPYSAGYMVYSSLIFRYFFLEDFKSGPISQVYLNKMIADFATARKAGVKLIPRFAYTDEVNPNGCSSFICPPYGDAPKNIVLGHITQLKSVLLNNEDVIAAVQMGFIGVWGENYYTDFFGDASQSPYSLSSTNWSDRTEVLDSLLHAVPKSRQVQVRYPQIKQKAIYGINAPTSSPPLTPLEAHNGTNKARIGFHNDCFLANFDDFGTYANYDNGTSDTTTLKPYKSTDSKYTMVGGETCNLYSGSSCESQGGLADKDLRRMHYTYLNADYNNDVNDTWLNFCLNDIKLNLGYRLALIDGTYTNSILPGGTFNYIINLVNKGYAAPANERDVLLVLRAQSTEEEWEVPLNHDPRIWHTGNHQIAGEVCLPSCMPIDNYDLYLALSDPMPMLRKRKEYAIRLANTGVWENATGYNNLGHTITVPSGVGSCSSNLEFAPSININEWISSSNGTWYGNASNWSLGRFPGFCDEVLIPNGKTVYILDGEEGRAGKVKLKSGSLLQIAENGSISVNQ